jgi:hypothetical protein
VFTNQSALRFLSWQATGQSLLGSLKSSQARGAQITTLESSFSGKLEDKAVTLNFGSVVLAGTLQGQNLSLSGEGLWVPATQGEYAQLLSAFQAQETLRGALSDLSQLIKDLPTDSDPSTANFQAIGVRQSVDNLEAFWMSVQALPDHRGQCQMLNQQLTLYYPLHNDSFAIRVHPEKSQLALALAAEQDAARKAGKVSVPRVVGLSLPWLVSQGEEHQGTEGPLSLFAKLNIAAEQGQKQLDGQHARYLTLVPQMEALKATC